MTRTRKFLARAMVSALAVAFLYAVGNAAESRKFTLGYSTVGPAGTGLWMAKEIGAFEKYGLQTELIFISSGPVVVQALIVLFIAAPPLVRAIFRIPVRASEPVTAAAKGW